ncbi:MAG: Rne/Rng family ribonuclease [Propionibacteriaceae bacterium]|nr:Rne/Rng family ribonuclease [Propionibacteriaceae bacterium]
MLDDQLPTTTLDQPDAAESGSPQTVSSQPDSAQPVSASPESNQPDSFPSVSNPPDSFPTDSAQIGSPQPDSAQPESGQATGSRTVRRSRRTATTPETPVLSPMLEGLNANLAPPTRRRARRSPVEASTPIVPAVPIVTDPASSQPTPTVTDGATSSTPPTETEPRSRRGRRRPATDTPGTTLEVVPPTSHDLALRSETSTVLVPVTPATDAIGEALQELSQSRTRGGGRGRRRRAAETPEALDDLAAAIAGDSEITVRLTPAAEPPIETDPDQTGDGPETGDESDDGPRRRRRRGGRRHRRTGDGDSVDTTGEAADTGDEAEAAEATDEASPDAAESGDTDSNNRRRRRRRRRGGEAGDSDVETAPSNRRSNRTSSNNRDEVTGIEGSTRLEAKRQRRREGRAASRRRAPILSEAEFLARRESVNRVMVIKQSTEFSQIAVLEDQVLVEHYVDRTEATSLIGNVYLGRIQNVLPSMEAAFIDIGRGRNAVLFAGEVDWESLGAEGEKRKVEEVFTSGQAIVVQVTKDPVGAKGARLTSHISIPGRYVVYAPHGHLSGISRKLADQERSRLKAALDGIVGNDASVIIRTAAEGASTEELAHDISRLKAQWEVIEKKAAKGQAPQLLYAEPDLTMRIVRDLFTEDFSELIVDGNGSMTDAYETVQAYVQHVAPTLIDRVKPWDKEQGDIYGQFRIDEQIAKALDRKVHLPSGGTLIIDRTEAMTVIDVNTGKFTGSGGTLEATVTSNNLEAAEEIVRQLRLRDIGGIIVIDFIDMVLPSNRELLLKRLVECLSRDRTRHQVSEVTSLGLVQMTRKRVGTGLAAAFTIPCEHCDGLGYQRLTEPVSHPVAPDGGDRGHNNHRRHRRQDQAKA